MTVFWLILAVIAAALGYPVVAMILMAIGIEHSRRRCDARYGAIRRVLIDRANAERTA